MCHMCFLAWGPFTRADWDQTWALTHWAGNKQYSTSRSFPRTSWTEGSCVLHMVLRPAAEIFQFGQGLSSCVTLFSIQWFKLSKSALRPSFAGSARTTQIPVLRLWWPLATKWHQSQSWPGEKLSTKEYKHFYSSIQESKQDPRGVCKFTTHILMRCVSTVGTMEQCKYNHN